MEAGCRGRKSYISSKAQTHFKKKPQAVSGQDLAAATATKVCEGVENVVLPLFRQLLPILCWFSPLCFFQQRGYWSLDGNEGRRYLSYSSNTAKHGEPGNNLTAVTSSLKTGLTALAPSSVLPAAWGHSAGQLTHHPWGEN